MTTISKMFKLNVKIIRIKKLVELLVQNWNQLIPYFKRLDYVFEK